MFIRSCTESDLPRVVNLAVEVFGPFHENSFRPAVGEVVFAHQDADWRADYARQLPELHSPDDHREIVVAEVDGGLAGFAAWTASPADGRGEITHVAVSGDHRRLGLGRALCEHAFEQLRAAGARVVTIGTGGDDFHAPARALYASLGCTPFPLVTYYREL
ncbi:GNAT family N-acetyltransferase [Plantactinospora siamensis]|uniref:GNAT family N-acetyltransferase n=1 Tax=Plantactinospora siamensis TaxID=555372 RepID=A0ABV6NWZ9_9ACTN